MHTKHIAFFIPALYGGGAERMVVNLLQGMSARDISLDLVLASAEGPYLDEVPKQVRVVNLAAGRTLKAILPLSRYLRKERPDALISQLNHANVAAVIARELARTKTPLVLVEQNTFSASRSPLMRAKLIPPLMKWFYPRADAIVGVSNGVARDLEVELDLGEGTVSTIYNSIVYDKLKAKAAASLNHPWFQAGSPPIFLAVGRLTEQKDFLTLIKAFALLRKQRLARLIILGEGKSRTELEATIDALGIAEDISLPGFVKNPYAYMSRASAFVLSSREEGLPMVLIEAMACGCPVVATDCAGSGPREILEAEQYGYLDSLVPVGDEVALSAAMLQVLESPVNRDRLVQRAMDFSIDRAVSEYLALLGYT
ncbi:glycosyltransferase [Pleurocapsales cyanobacterium LEGE 06147]|nr:glycosyltransferase [Pleurocapsales cyanobacterium LEGE 06147]